MLHRILKLNVIHRSNRSNPVLLIVIFTEKVCYLYIIPVCILYQINIDMQQIYYMNKCLFKENMVLTAIYL